MKRTQKELLLLVLSIFAAITVTSFSIFRFLRFEWLIASFDLLVGIGMALIAYHVYTTQKVVFPSIVLAVLSCFASIATVHVKGAENVIWVYPALVSAYYLLSPKRAIYISLFTLIMLIPVLLQGLEITVFSSTVTTIVMTCLFGYFFSKSVRQQHEILNELVIKDSLTGVGNRRALDQKLEEIVQAQARKPSTVSLILLDLDRFKRVNDNHGHIVGDQILIRVAEIIEGRIRTTDSLYRYGGEEFVIVAIDLDLEAASQLAEELRVLVESFDLVISKPITISLGVAEYKAGENGESLINRADEALYRAKTGGRNQVCSATSKV